MRFIMEERKGKDIIKDGPQGNARKRKEEEDDS